MLIVFHWGTVLVPNSIVSTTRRMEGSGGKMYSFWAIYSLRISFWVVPRSCSGRTPCFSAVAMYMAQMIAAGELMVMLVETLSRGIPSRRISISFKEETATPHFPNSPNASGASVSKPIRVGRSKAIDNPVWPCSRRYLNRALVSSAVPNPANMRMVHSRPRCRVG